MLMQTLAFIDGIGFDPFFRGLLSFLAMFVVLVGGTYLLIATNTGVRQGMLISVAGLFGWMFLMGVIWTIYGQGWKGGDPTWSLVEMNTGELAIAVTPEAQSLAQIDISNDLDDPDESQAQALTSSKDQDLDGWRYLITSDGTRGEAQASAESFLVTEPESALFESPDDYQALPFGAFTTGGKPILKEDANMLDRVGHFFNETFLHPTHSQELMLIQVQAVVPQRVDPGKPPPVAIVDTSAPVISVIMERDRGGPIPSVISGLRFTPLMFTIFTGLIFAASAFALHNRDQRQIEIAAS